MLIFIFRRLSTRTAFMLKYSPSKRGEGKTKSDGIAKAPTESQAGYFSATYRVMKIQKTERNRSQLH